MRLLLDTHALLWWLADEGLTDQARDAVADPANLVMVSAVSAWEISIKKALGKLAAPDDLERQVDEGGFTPLSISIGHGIAAGELPRHHDDPFDRMLIAQAVAEGLTVVTHDKRFADYDVAILPT
ncbi:MAG TPA: type II toxin-antitoxin system VapC family toxin [Streptosporangiaceae bacterium]|nr:type II toxin-antitoxin system VapC family toxin [Streptosporangiaceae bacterium]